MHKFFFSLLLIIQLTTCLGQDTYDREDPNFSFKTLQGWKDYGNLSSPLEYFKIVRVRNERIDGILRVGRDIYFDDISTIWELDSDYEKAMLQQEAVLTEYSFKKETINSMNCVKINFSTKIKDKHFKAVTYKFLLEESQKDYVIFFFLITSPENYMEDSEDLKKMISTLKFSHEHLNQKADSEFHFAGYQFKIDQPLGYSTFDKSEKSLTKADYSHSTQSQIPVTDFEILIPKNKTDEPTLFIQSFSFLDKERVTQSDFDGYKKVWTDALKSGQYEKFADSIFSNQTIINRFGNIDLEQKGYIILQDSSNCLSTILLAEDTSGRIQKTIIIQNYIFIQKTIIFIKSTMPYNEIDDISKASNITLQFVNNFINSNES